MSFIGVAEASVASAASVMDASLASLPANRLLASRANTTVGATEPMAILAETTFPASSNCTDVADLVPVS
jgi:hypothetical protein